MAYIATSTCRLTFPAVLRPFKCGYLVVIARMCPVDIALEEKFYFGFKLPLLKSAVMSLQYCRSLCDIIVSSLSLSE